MSVESAEMTKHAINAFLATSVTFINELAALCEQSGADAKEVERGLKTERRIGPQPTCRLAALRRRHAGARRGVSSDARAAASAEPRRCSTASIASNAHSRDWARAASRIALRIAGGHERSPSGV